MTDWDLKRLKSHSSWIVIKEFLVMVLDKYGDPANGGDHVVESSNELETQISWDPSYSWKCLHPSVNHQYSYLQRIVSLKGHNSSPNNAIIRKPSFYGNNKVRHGNTGQNFLTRPKKYLTWTRFFDLKQKLIDPMTRPDLDNPWPDLFKKKIR